MMNTAAEASPESEGKGHSQNSKESQQCKSSGAEEDFFKQAGDLLSNPLLLWLGLGTTLYLLWREKQENSSLRNENQKLLLQIEAIKKDVSEIKSMLTGQAVEQEPAKAKPRRNRRPSQDQGSGTNHQPQQNPFRYFFG